MYITRNPEIARIVENAGVDWIFIDMEYIDKDLRQCGLDTVKNHHTIEDIRNIKQATNIAKVLVRINPLHDGNDIYTSSKEEIDVSIDAGADIIMLPYFHTVEEVREFISYVNGRAQTCLLLETPEAADAIDDILEVPGIDMIHIGLNDMYLAMEMDFMFELLANGTVENLLKKMQAKGIMCGFGGVAGLQSGMLPGAKILKEHCRLKSEMVIVSRTFCNTDIITDKNEIAEIFNNGIKELRALEAECAGKEPEYFEENRKEVVKGVNDIVEIIRQKKNKAKEQK